MNDKKIHPHFKHDEEGHYKQQVAQRRSGEPYAEAGENHPEWELEKQTEGLDPAVEEASKKLEKEMTSHETNSSENQ